MRTMPNNTLNTDGPKACAFETGAVRGIALIGAALGWPTPSAFDEKPEQELSRYRYFQFAFNGCRRNFGV